jgi:hypothetical protein
MEDMLGLPTPVVDELYEVLGVLLGIKGTWHRLWGCMAFDHAFRDSIEDADGVVLELRDEFEELLGRPMTDREWSAVDAHAARHAEIAAAKFATGLPQ